MHSNLFHKSRLWCCSQRFNNPAFGEGEALLTHDWLPRWFSLEIVDMSQAFPLHPDTQLSIHIPPLEWSNKNRRSRCKSWTTGKHDKMLCRCCCPCCIVIVEVFWFILHLFSKCICHNLPKELKYFYTFFFASNNGVENETKQL